MARRGNYVDERKRTGTSTDIVESKLSDEGVELKEEREGLADATTSTKDGNLGELCWKKLACGLQDLGELVSTNWVGV